MGRLSVISKLVTAVLSVFVQSVYATSRTVFVQRAACLVMGFVILTGCQGADEAKPVPAAGVITLNGEPLAGAYVLFIPETGPKASATTDKDGGFDLTTVKDKDGVVPGPCRIAVEKREPIDQKNPYVIPKSLIPEKYASVKDSGLTETVGESGENFFSIDLKK
ncbi:MAG: hypothetical protein JWN70_4161 [Planctomycetaceae bacterium]|nr:hypothetical protein [Planctomycetaceae bacterium]